VSNAEENLGGMSYHEWKKSVVMRMERQYLQHQLEHFHGNVSAMSRSMKVTRPNLCRLLKKHALIAEDFRKNEQRADTTVQAA
jgi:DNA-binding NtrC family response regulator